MIVPLPEHSPDIRPGDVERACEHRLRVEWHQRRAHALGTYGRRIYTIQARETARRLRELRRAS